ncbi:hypothetical protein GGR57DRAFT_425961 [Xylariaceae sp. FL1272]|nr:hypothetical protein GGR57DRAFT_425961 [Xylariaceae sp. FL1272]
MGDDWTISQPFQYVNEEDAQFLHHDRPGQTHREHLTGWEAENYSGVKGRLTEVVHGYNDKGKPRTLVVFEWRFVPGAGRARIKNVEILVSFHATGERDGVAPGDRLDDYNPVPIRWAPNKPVLSLFSQATVTETGSNEFGATAGYDPYLSLTAKHGDELSQTVVRIDHRRFTGAVAYTTGTGPPNAVKWTLSENAQLKSGVQYEAHTAVLLRRQPHDRGKFDLTVKVEGHDSRTHRLLRAMHLRPRDGPAAFDPAVLPGSSDGEAGDDDVAARSTARNWRDLDKLDLEQILVKDWMAGSLDELASRAS